MLFFGSVFVFLIAVFLPVLLFRLELWAPLFPIPRKFWVCSACSLCFSTGDTDFQSLQVFQRGGTWFWSVDVCVCSLSAHSVFFVACQELLNHLALISFPDEWQSVHTFSSPKETDLFIFSGVVAFWQIWLVRWWHMRLSRKRLWPVFEIHQENLLTFNSLDCRQVSGICFTVAFEGGFTYSLRQTARILPRFSRVGSLMFLNVCRASPLMREWK